MRGNVIQVNPADGSGVLEDWDGKLYAFRSDVSLRVGDEITFSERSEPELRVAVNVRKVER